MSEANWSFCFLAYLILVPFASLKWRHEGRMSLRYSRFLQARKGVKSLILCGFKAFAFPFNPLQSSLNFNALAECLYEDSDCVSSQYSSPFGIITRR